MDVLTATWRAGRRQECYSVFIIDYSWSQAVAHLLGWKIADDLGYYRVSMRRDVDKASGLAGALAVKAAIETFGLVESVG